MNIRLVWAPHRLKLRELIQDCGPAPQPPSHKKAELDLARGTSYIKGIHKNKLRAPEAETVRTS